MATDRDADVPDPDHHRIIADDHFGSEPRIRGRRIAVLDGYEQVTEGDGDQTPHEFAETFSLPVADVYAALAYYHANTEEIDEFQAEQESASESLCERAAQDRLSSVEPPEQVMVDPVADSDSFDTDEWCFFIDENLDPEIVVELERQDFRVAHVLDALFEGADDFTDVLPYCRQNRAIIVTNTILAMRRIPPEDHNGAVIFRRYG